VIRIRIRTYTELSQLATFDERFDYLKLGTLIGEKSFGHERWMNQRFYSGREWKLVRDHVIARDLGCDLGIQNQGREFRTPPHVHHLNPMRPQDIIDNNVDILDPEFLVSVAFNTHNAIHFGDRNKLTQPEVERRPGDTLLWGRRPS